MVVAPIVTERAHTDKTVRLLVGDHPFIRHASNVSYGDAEFAFLGKLTDAVARGEASMAQPVSGALLRRMQDGLLMSSRTIHVIVDYVRSFLAEYE